MAQRNINDQDLLRWHVIERLKLLRRFFSLDTIFFFLPVTILMNVPDSNLNLAFARINVLLSLRFLGSRLELI